MDKILQQVIELRTDISIGLDNETSSVVDRLMQIQKDLEQLKLYSVSKRYYHEVCGKGTLIKEYEHSVYGTMLMVKPLNKKDMYFAPKREFTELPFS